MVKAVSFTPYGGDTIKALQARQAALQESAPELPGTQNMRSPFQGASYLANTLVNTLQQNAAVSQEREARKALATLIGGHDPGEDWSGADIGQASAIDPDTGLHIMDLQAARELAERKTAADAAKDNAPKISDTTSLRGQLMGDESYVSMSSTAPIYGSMLKSADQDDRTSDLDLVSGLAKMIDPTGVVRGEDVNMIVANQPGMELFKNYLETWKSDPKARLGPEIRRDIMRLAYDRASGASAAYNRRANEFRQIAKSYGLPENMVVPTFDEIRPWAPAAPEPDPDPDPDAALTPEQKSGAVPVIKPDGQLDFSRMSEEQFKTWAAQQQVPAKPGGG